MNKIKKGMIDLEETKRINKELIKIYQEQEQINHQDNEQINSRHQQTIRQYQPVFIQTFVFIYHLFFCFFLPSELFSNLLINSIGTYNKVYYTLLL